MFAVLFGTPAEVHYTTLANGILPASIVKMPILAAGTGGYNDTAATAAVQSSLRAGFAHVHTAFDYFNLKGVAQGIEGVPRDRLFISSMTSPCVHAAPPKRNVTDPSKCYALTITEVESLFEKLQLPMLDLIMLHGPSEAFGHMGGCSQLACDLARAQWKAYSTFLSSGRVRAIGVSNFCQSCLKCLADNNFGSNGAALLPAVNQIQVHVGQGSADPGGGLLSYCAQRQIVVQAYEPLAGGALATDAFVAAIGLKHNKTAAQVALKWVLQRAPALAVRAGSEEHLVEDRQLFDFTLDGSDLVGLDARTGPPGEAGGRCSWGCTE
jgi:diketogulonate reductase-like aldo/keto reductase